MNEADHMRVEQMKASARGDRLFRNNVGVLIDKRGVPVRFGLAVGSGDLIGWRKVVITQEMVGTIIAQFSSLEIKNKKGRTTKEQIAWRNIVISAGGDARILICDEADQKGS